MSTISLFEDFLTSTVHNFT